MTCLGEVLLGSTVDAACILRAVREVPATDSIASPAVPGRRVVVVTLGRVATPVAVAVTVAVAVA